MTPSSPDRFQDGGQGDLSQPVLGVPLFDQPALGELALKSRLCRRIFPYPMDPERRTSLRAGRARFRDEPEDGLPTRWYYTRGRWLLIERQLGCPFLCRDRTNRGRCEDQRESLE
jgi:hypothetical protein